MLDKAALQARIRRGLAAVRPEVSIDSRVPPYRPIECLTAVEGSNRAQTALTELREEKET
jgi:hypothetical protein